MILFVCLIIFTSVLTKEPEVSVLKERRRLGKLPKYEIIHFTVPKGTDFFVDLPSSMTTGFSWEVKNADQYENIKFKGEGTLLDPSKKKKHHAGTAGRQGFRFSTLFSGKDIIELHYKRSWLKDPNKVYIIELEIK